MDKSGEAYWKAVLTLIAQVLAVWFFVSFGCGILFADALNSMSIGKFDVHEE
jgi:putative solute:sodium symporter small subunit